MEGLEKFREAFEAYSENYVIIGGTACDIAMTGTAVRPRATHDIDMIVIVEKMKQLHNAGTHPDLYFYRDSNGVEVDLVEHSAGKLYPIEIKSSSTFNPDFCKNLIKFNERYADKCAEPTVVYSGESDFTCKGVNVRAFPPMSFRNKV